jgi:hypothetical protein
MERVIPLTIKDKNILIHKADRYINENEIREVIVDIVENNLEIPKDKLIDLSSICDSMFNIMYKGVITMWENINDNDEHIRIDKMLFEVC